MNLQAELAKLTIIHRIASRWLQKYPDAYMDCGSIGDKMNAFHNYRAMKMQYVEQKSDYKLVVVFDKETKEAIALDRKYYLDNFDELYDKYHY